MKPDFVKSICLLFAFVFFIGLLYTLQLINGNSNNTPILNPTSPTSRKSDKQSLKYIETNLSTKITEQFLDHISPENQAPTSFKLKFTPPNKSGPVFAELRSSGILSGKGWSTTNDWNTAIPEAINQASALADSQKQPDSLVLVLTYNWRDIDAREPELWLSNIQRGVLGVMLAYEGRQWLRSPTEFISQNRSIRRFMELHREACKVKETQYLAKVKLQVFDGYQFLISLKEHDIAVTPLFRGNTLVPMTDITRGKVTALAEAQSTWMFENLLSNGRMRYKWWPSAGKASDANNMIRQFMATTCLGRVARWKNSSKLLKRQEQNVAYNFSHFYTEEKGLGIINCIGDSVKLGAVGLAALALMERFDLVQYEDKRDALLKMILHLYQEDGSFHTFYRPEERKHELQNFYSGEALLAWATWYRQHPNPELLERYMKAFRYYRDWHLDPANRNPAFIPWHTQAHFFVWQETQDSELLNFIFQMNDWLVDEMLQWEDVAYDDMRGRFYKPGGSYGPPHASSTGVYLEGLADAFVMARTVGDTTRMNKYRQAICRGLRSVMQLTFLDDADMFYVSQRDRVYGGVRTTVYDNEIRVDNVQHNLMAILKVLKEFTEEDYLLGSRQDDS